MKNSPPSRGLATSYKAVAFCTPGPYEREAALLRHSAEKYGVDLFVQLIDPLPSWSHAVMYKPQFLREMLTLFDGQPILYVDADACFRSKPADQPEGVDFAAHWFKRSREHAVEILTGTLYLKNTPLVREFVDAWVRATVDYGFSSTPEQESLKRIFENWKDRLVWKDFGPEMVWIFDDFPEIYGKDKRPIIEHFQASRRLRTKKA